MRLFVWDDILRSYTGGVGFALADNVQQARELIIGSALADPTEEIVKYRAWQTEVAADDDCKYRGYPLWRDLMAEPAVYESPFGYYLYGGD